MAGYGYSYRGYSAYSAPQSEDLSKTRLAIFDAEGRRRPAISSAPYQNLESTRIVEQRLGLPLASEYKHGTPIASIPVEEYGARDDRRTERKEARWNQSDRPKPVEEYGARDDGRMERKEERWNQSDRPKPVEEYGARDDGRMERKEVRWNQSDRPKPVEEYGARDDGRMERKEARWNQSDRPKPVDEFLNKVQTEASRPRFEPLHPSCWRQAPAYVGNQSSTGGYAEYRDMSNTGWQNPNGNAHRNEKHDSYYQKNDSTMDPTMITNGGWTRPSHSQPTDAAALSRPTSDIGTAMAILQEAARPTAAAAGPTPPRYADATYNEIIDHKEATRRYGQLNYVPRPYAAEDKYATVIDSREAARKYRGTII